MPRHVALLTVSALLCASCATPVEDSEAAQRRPAQYMALVGCVASGVFLEYVPDPLPATTAIAPSVAVTSLDTFTPMAPGAEAWLGLTGSGAFTNVYVTVDGLAGHWVGAVGSRVTDELAFIVGDRAPARFTVRIAVGGPDGVGPSASVPVVTGQPLSPPLVFVSTDVPKAILDTYSNVSILTVSGAASTVSEVTVTVSLNHTYIGDLVLKLRAPSGEEVVLASQLGSTADAYAGTTFDDAAAVSITAAAPPFSGTFRPQTPLSTLAGRVANGTWSLVIDDLAAQDSGTLTSWSLTIR